MPGDSEGLGAANPRTDGGEEPIECPFCEDGEMYRDGSKVECASCGQVKLA